MGYNREFLEDEGSEDCFGRCMWALCFTFSNPATPQNVKKACMGTHIEGIAELHEAHIPQS